MNDLVEDFLKPLGLTSPNIDVVEKEFLKLPQVQCPVIHRFGPGTYIRELSVKAGTFLIGHHQNFEHTNIFLKGRVTLLNDDGSTTDLQAPMIFVGKPGRKIGFIQEDMVWLNVYATEEKDVEKLEAHFLTKSEGFCQSFKAHESVRLLKKGVDNSDYLQTLMDLNVSEEVVRAQSENQADMIDLPFGHYKIKVAQSSIEGQGLFATAEIEAGEIIAPARIQGKRTIAGRFTNHSPTPNAEMVKGLGEDINLVAIQSISGCVGGLDGQEITINYRDAVNLNLNINSQEVLCQV